MSRSIFHGSSSDLRTVNGRLLRASEEHNLVSPATSCAQLPPGYEVALSIIRVRTAEGPACEVFLGEDGLFVLKSVPLKRIASAAGLEWIPKECGRLKGPTHAHYCRYRAVGRARVFDASWRVVTGEAQIDVRAGSEQAVELSKARLDNVRAHILGHAETQAKTRAICDLGLKRMYSLEELARGFAVARLVWTGRSRSKAIREAFALKQADAQFSGTSAIYGSKDAP